MGLGILVLGHSGSGKSSGMRNFEEGELAVVNTYNKPLPFRGKKFNALNGCTDASKIIRFIQSAPEKSIVIDDCQYLMGVPFMNRVKEKGWDKFNDIQGDYFQVLDAVRDLAQDKIVYFLSHTDTNEDGFEKVKTIGKMLDEKICIEGLFSVVLKTHVSDGNYMYLTQNNGKDTVKSPIGMFPTYAIDNDLKYVDDKIRNYYEMIGCKTDEQIAQDDQKSSVDGIEKGKNGRTVRSSKSEEKQTENESNTRRRTTESTHTETATNISESNKAIGEVTTSTRTRRTRQSEPTHEDNQSQKTGDTEETPLTDDTPEYGDGQFFTEDNYFRHDESDSFTMYRKGEAIPGEVITGELISITREEYNAGILEQRRQRMSHAGDEKQEEQSRRRRRTADNIPVQENVQEPEQEQEQEQTTVRTRRRRQ